MLHNMSIAFNIVLYNIMFYIVLKRIRSDIERTTKINDKMIIICANEILRPPTEYKHARNIIRRYYNVYIHTTHESTIMTL